MHSTRWSSRFRSARYYMKTGPRGYCIQCTRRAINLIKIYHNKKWNVCNNGGAQCPYQTNTSNQSKADNSQVLRQNTELLFGPWQGLRQGDLLSTLLFNVVLEAIVQLLDTTFLDAGQTAAFGDMNFEEINALCIWKLLWQRRMTWVWRSKLQIGASTKTSAIISPGTSDYINDLQDRDPLRPAVGKM
jgi:hypothetical protein